MTNANIILNESIALMEKGILSGTDLKMIVEDAEGNKKEIALPEEIHTSVSAGVDIDELSEVLRSNTTFIYQRAVEKLLKEQDGNSKK